jgi:signal transduction histidine kinase
MNDKDWCAPPELAGTIKARVMAAIEEIRRVSELEEYFRQRALDALGECDSHD